jgi:hypothetical protein
MYTLLNCSTGVIGVENNTTVTIHFPSSVKGHSVTWQGQLYGHGRPLTFDIQAFQTFQVQCDDDLTGSHVTANQRVAVISGSSRNTVPVGSGSSDHMVEMIPPTTTWGKMFYTAPIAKRQIGDIFRIIGSIKDIVKLIYCDNSYYIV